MRRKLREMKKRKDRQSLDSRMIDCRQSPKISTNIRFREILDKYTDAAVLSVLVLRDF